MRQHLIGVWKLVSYETEKPDGSIVTPFGREVRGLLVYTADGFMSGQVMKEGRESPSSDGYIAYCGAWRADEPSGEVIHTVHASLHPGWAGTEQRRGVRFDGGDLILSAVTERPGSVWTSRLRWRRA